jgi:hypothetical protein
MSEFNLIARHTSAVSRHKEVRESMDTRRLLYFTKGQ